MQTRRGTVLGKRSHHQDTPSSSSSTSVICDDQSTVLPTPEPTPNPKRVRTSGSVLDGDANKENVPPFRGQLVAGDSPTRSLRRMSTELSISTGARQRPSTPRRHASLSRLPSAALSSPASESSHVAPPTPPITPEHRQASNKLSIAPLHTRARTLLRSTCSGQQLAGRDTERAVISEFLSGFLVPQYDTVDATTLYISGSPGTGKTALISALLEEISIKTDDVKVVNINCMSLNGMDALWERLCEELSEPQISNSRGCPKTAKSKGREAVEDILRNLKTKCVLVLDELDHVASSPSSMTVLLSLPSAWPQCLRIIGIANTHTLTSASCLNSSLQDHVKTLHFPPYMPQQLLAILRARLAPLAQSELDSLLPQPTLMLATQKIAALTGDVRALLEVLRLALDISSSSSPSSSSPPSSVTKVTPAHVLTALKAQSFTSTGRGTTSTKVATETTCKILALSLQARIVLLTLLIACKRFGAGLSLLSPNASFATPSRRSPVKRSLSTNAAITTSAGSSLVDVTQLYSSYTSILDSADERVVLNPVGRSEFNDLLGVLETSGFVMMHHVSSSPRKGGGKTFRRSASFGGSGAKFSVTGTGSVKLADGVRREELLRALGVEGDDEAPVVGVNEELRTIWLLETRRLAKEVKATIKEQSAEWNLLEDASQD